MRRTLLPILLLAALPAALLPVWGAEHGAPAGPQGAPKTGKPGTNVDLEFLIAPLTAANGKLIGYAYINPRLTVVSESFVTPVRDKVPFIQDAFIRDVNSKSVATEHDPQQVDIAGVESRLLANAVRIMGPGKVKMITICTVQIAELHPVQTPSPNAPDTLQAADAHGNPQRSRCEAARPA
jgi:hypothetical protein